MKKQTLLFLAIIISAMSFAQNVGIGTTSPDASAQLDVSSTTKGFLLPRMTTIQRTGIANPAIGLKVFDSDTKTFWFYNGAAWTESATGSAINYWTKTGNDIFNNNSGNIGIGMINPTTKLEIGAPSATTGVELSLSANTADYYSRLQFRNITMGNSRVWWLGGLVNSGAGTNDLFTFYHTTGGNILTLKGSGDVGIGTTNPSARLEIAAPSSVTGVELSLSANTANNYSRLEFKNQTMGNSRVWWVGGLISSLSSDNDMLTFSNTTGGNILALKGNGNVGIGTLNPGSYKLAVNGNVHTKEIVVETGWADYVFDENYELPSLNEVQKFIKQHKHLPDIPSSKEIKENGLNLGEMQRKMMAKIEELTIYVLQANEKIEDLTNEIKLLKNKK